VKNIGRFCGFFEKPQIHFRPSADEAPARRKAPGMQFPKRRCGVGRLRQRNTAPETDNQKKGVKTLWH
jgi:hypothetical protein